MDEAGEEFTDEEFDETTPATSGTSKKTSAEEIKNEPIDVVTPNVAASAISYPEAQMIIESNDMSDVRYSLLVVLALSSLTVYGLIISG